MAISDYVATTVGGVQHGHPPWRPDRPTRPVAAEQRPRVVLVAQRLEAEKETDLAVTAFARSGLADAGWRLELAGDGAERAASRRPWRRSSGIAASTDFLGHRSDVPQLMRRASMLLAPCRVEGLGLTVLEAMAEALPVVAVGAGGHLETVGSVAGAALHPAGDSAAAATLLASLARDPEARDVVRLGPAAGPARPLHPRAPGRRDRRRLSRGDLSGPRGHLARGLGHGVAAQPAPRGGSAPSRPGAACALRRAGHGSAARGAGRAPTTARTGTSRARRGTA